MSTNVKEKKTVHFLLPLGSLPEKKQRPSLGLGPAISKTQESGRMKRVAADMHEALNKEINQNI